MRSPTFRALAAYMTARSFAGTTVNTTLCNLRLITPDGVLLPPNSEALDRLLAAITNDVRRANARAAWRVFSAFQASVGIEVPALLNDAAAPRTRARLAEARTAAPVPLPPKLTALRATLLGAKASPAAFTWSMFMNNRATAEHYCLMPPVSSPRDIALFFFARAEIDAALVEWTQLWGRQPTVADYLFAVPSSTSTGASGSGTVGSATAPASADPASALAPDPGTT